MANKKNTWNEDDIKYLNSVWEDNNIPTNEICYKLNRNMKTISAKARKIGLSRGCSIFTKEELELLEKVYPNMSNKEIQEKYFPNKTDYQIMNAGYNHNFKKTEEYISKSQIEVGIRNLSVIGDQSGDKSPKWVERKLIYCDNCGKEIYRTEARTKNNNYCSRECQFSAYILNYRGENNPNFRDGYADLKKYGRLLLTDWKKDSMKSCNYKCIISGNKFDDIHHIKTYDDIFYETINELSLNGKILVEELTDEEIILFRNKIIEVHYRYPLGVCLTKELHAEFHSIYGRSQTTIENWNDFYKNKKLS